MPLVVSSNSSSTAVAVVQSSSNEAPNDQQPEQIEQATKSPASPASDKTTVPESADTGHDKANKPVLVAINELSKYNKVRLGLLKGSLQVRLS